MYVYDQAHALAKAIKESPEYKMVKKQKDKIGGDPQLKKMFNDYRTKQIELQRIQFMGQQVPDDKLQEFRRLHDIVIVNPILKEFLEAEQHFATVMADIQKIMVEGLGLD